jgi:hypothetical protein
MPPSVRAPLFLFGAGLVLLLVAFALDLGPEGARDVALLLGTYVLYVLLPLASVWLVVAVLLARHRRR